MWDASDWRDEKSLLLFKNFPQEEIHETEFHLTSSFPVCQRKRPWKIVESFTIAEHYDSESLREASTVSPVKAVWKGVNTSHASLKYFSSNYAIPNTTEDGGGVGWGYCFSIQRCLQELGLSLFHKSLHSDRRWSASQLAHRHWLTSGATASLKRQAKQKGKQPAPIAEAIEVTEGLRQTRPFIL